MKRVASRGFVRNNLYVLQGGETGGANSAEAVEGAITNVLGSGKIRDLGAGRMGYTTSEVGDLIAAEVKSIGK